MLPPASKKSRLELIREARRSSQVAAGGGVAGAEGKQCRQRWVVAMGELWEYLEEGAAFDDDSFDLLAFWKEQATARFTPLAGGLVVGARWPHLSMISRVFHGVQPNCCFHEMRFPCLGKTLSDLSSKVPPHQAAKMLLVSLNRHMVAEVRNHLDREENTKGKVGPGCQPKVKRKWC
ncbi:unnamed protein product [Discosporangium mesarthrocarpum]